MDERPTHSWRRAPRGALFFVDDSTGRILVTVAKEMSGSFVVQRNDAARADAFINESSAVAAVHAQYPDVRVNLRTSSPALTQDAERWKIEWPDTPLARG